ncbi:MAG: hypothetical protein VXZ38_12625 [Planctomycetota bacterium]|nr:hypothetical protein [Planctomycetota bacterium]
MRLSNTRSLALVSCCVLINLSTGHAGELEKKLAPFIGRWTGTSAAFGGFEGTTDKGQLKWEVSFRWLPGKKAVQQSWEIQYAGTEENFSSGTEILHEDPVSGALSVTGFGMDGDVTWSNQGIASTKPRGYEVELTEQTENGSQSKYKVSRVKRSKDVFVLTIPKRSIDGKDYDPIPAIELKKTPYLSATHRKLTEQFFATVLDDPEALKKILHKEFKFAYMSTLPSTLIPYGKPYSTEEFIEKWLPHVGKLLPEGIDLKTTQTIASSSGAVVIQEGRAKGRFGKYNNRYAWVFNFRDGKILTVEEYNSDALVGGALYGMELIIPPIAFE